MTTVIENLSIRQRMVSSKLFAFALQFLVALIIVALFGRSFHLEWVSVITGCLVYALVVTFVVQLYLKKYSQSLGLTNITQLRFLNSSLITNTLPIDPTLLNALPVFLDRNQKTIESSHKSFKANLVIFGFMLLMALITRNWIGSIIFITFLGVLLYTEFRLLKKEEERISALKGQLEQQGIGTNTDSEEKNNRWIQRAAFTRKVILLSSVTTFAIMTGLVALIIHTNNQAVPLPYHFSSSDYDFTVNLPNKPRVDNQTTKTTDSEQNLDITTITSTQDMRGQSQSFGVVVYRWPDEVSFTNYSESKLRTILDNHVKDTTRDIKAKIINNNEREIFSGNTIARQAKFSFQNDGHSNIGYTRVFTVRNIMYVIIGFNANDATFEKFANSFDYTGSSNATMPATDIGAIEESSSRNPTRYKITPSNSGPHPVQVPANQTPLEAECGPNAVGKVSGTCVY